MKISWEGVGNFYRESGDLPGATKTKTFAGKVVFTVLSNARHLPRLGAGFFIFVSVLVCGVFGCFCFWKLKNLPSYWCGSRI